MLGTVGDNGNTHRACTPARSAARLLRHRLIRKRVDEERAADGSAGTFLRFGGAVASGG